MIDRRRATRLSFDILHSASQGPHPAIGESENDERLTGDNVLGAWGTWLNQDKVKTRWPAKLAQSSCLFLY